METREQTSNLTPFHIPALVETLRLRQRDPYAYDSATQQVFEFDEDAIVVMRLVDGKRSVMDIAEALAGKGHALVNEIAQKCCALLDSCAQAGAVTWYPKGAASEEPTQRAYADGNLSPNASNAATSNR